MNQKARTVACLFLFFLLTLLFAIRGRMPLPGDYLPALLPLLSLPRLSLPGRVMRWLLPVVLIVEIPLVALLPPYARWMDRTHLLIVGAYALHYWISRYGPLWKDSLHFRRIKICRRVGEAMTELLIYGVMMTLMAFPLVVPECGGGEGSVRLLRIGWALLSAVPAGWLCVWLGLCLHRRQKPVAAYRRMHRDIAMLQQRENDARRVTLESDPARALYQKAVELMRTQRAFLLRDFTLSDMARRLYTNKAYLSRTINTFSGRGFRTFVNYFRIRYSIELFERNMGLKVHALAELCGFHSQVTYTIAFKAELGMPPGEYFGRIVLGFEVPSLPEYPSTKEEPEA